MERTIFFTPVTNVIVYFLVNKLPKAALICRAGFPLIADNLVMSTENPTQIISTATNDRSEFANFVQYLKHPSVHRTEYDALANRMDILRKQGVSI